MRALVQEILARRAPQPPAEFLALQVSRLNEALFVSYNAMSGLNLQAVDRVVKIVRELDRYHGFSATEQAQVPDAFRPPCRRAALSRWRRRRPAGPEMAPQPIEKAQFAPGNGAGGLGRIRPAYRPARRISTPTDPGTTSSFSTRTRTSRTRGCLRTMAATSSAMVSMKSMWPRPTTRRMASRITS